jgi:predicted nuclease of predicted toxin-antitoxin system
MKFLLDVNASGSLGRWLTEMGHDVVLVSSADPSMKDQDVLEWAVREDRIIITTDQDFERMIWLEGRKHKGVLRLENLPRSERRLLLEYVLEHYNQELASEAIIIALKQKIRIRRSFPKF